MIKQPILHSTPTVADWHFPNTPLRLVQDGDTEGETSPQADVLVAEPEVAKPPMYAVVMYNDNYTPMEFVVYVLQSEFRQRYCRYLSKRHCRNQSQKGQQLGAP